MTLEEAIKILDQWYSLDTLLPLDKAQDALKLGIEALKAIQRVRPTEYDDIDLPLPGETGD